MSYEEKMAAIQKLRGQVSSMANMVEAKERNLSNKESLLRQGQIPTDNPRDVEKNMMRNLGPMLAPGNLGDINKIIWPFYFTTESPGTPIAPNETFQTGFSVTQEAAFIMMSYTKVVYNAGTLAAPAAVWTYADPNTNTLINRSPGLVYTLRDGSSARQLFNSAIELGHHGNPRFPTKWPRPIMFLPNQVIQIAFTNTDPQNLYVPFITGFGYRMRVEDAQNFLSLIYA